MKKIIFISLMVLALLPAVNGQSDANCNNLSLDNDTFYLFYPQDTIVNGHLYYMDSTWASYPLITLLLTDTSIITSHHVSSITWLGYGDTLHLYIPIHFLTASFPNNVIVAGFLRVYDCDFPPDTIVNCYLPVTIILQNTTGINSTREESKITIYPNPTLNELNIRNNSNQTIQFTLYNSMGEKAIDKILTNKSSTINLSAYSNDIYFYRVLADKHLIKSGKIIKQ